jgi:hypothetical protein
MEDEAEGIICRLLRESKIFLFLNQSKMITAQFDPMKILYLSATHLLPKHSLLLLIHNPILKIQLIFPKNNQNGQLQKLSSILLHRFSTRCCGRRSNWN